MLSCSNEYAFWSRGLNKSIFILNEKKIYSMSFQIELIVNQDAYSENHLIIPCKWEV